MSNKIKIGITIGDINGIGLEVVLKALYHPKITDLFTPIIYGNGKVMAYHKNIVEYDDFYFNNINKLHEASEGKVNVLNIWNENANITLGKPTQISGKYAAISLKEAVSELKNKKLDAVVTAPINKEAMQMSDFPHIGHTEFLTQKAGKKEALMLMISDEMKVGLVTAHTPLRDVSNKITEEKILEKLKMLIKTLKRDFGVEKPHIAVMGLNPHAGDGGHIGQEDQKIIRPVILKAKDLGAIVTGPFGADGFFGSGQHRKYDAILAMYHDQGLIPFKVLSFGRGVNYTAGLPFIRTSPDHGTAYEIAGANKADHNSFLNALYCAIDIVKNRKVYDESHSNPLKSG